jgi:hypothetical protein
MKNKRATLHDLANRFDTEPEAMRSMIEQWVQKGKVSKSSLRIRCNKGCSKCCSDAAVEIYEWHPGLSPFAKS